MTHRRTIWTGLLLTTLAVVIVVWLLWAPRTHQSAAGDNFGGRIETAGMVNLGTVSNGDIKQASIEIRNSGDASVTVGDFRTDCTCMKVYQLEGDEKRTVTRLIVPPGGVQTLYLDLRVSGEPGKQYASSVFFRDLETERDEYHVVVAYTPVARVYLVPHAVAFGVIPAGVLSTKRVEIRSDGSYSGDLAGLRSDNANISISVVTPTQSEKDVLTTTSRGQQHLIGYLDIAVRPSPEQTNYDDSLIIFQNSEEFLRLRVIARVDTAFSAAPSRLTLPRVEGGANVYKAKVIFHSRTGKSFRINSLSDGMPFDIKPADESGTVVVNYTGRTPSTVRVEFALLFELVDSDDDTMSFKLTVPVVILPSSQ